MAKQSSNEKEKMNEFEEKLKEVIKGKSPLDVLMALFTRGISTERTKVQWMFFMVFYVKKIYEVLSTLATMLIGIVVYTIVVFIAENLNNAGLLFDRLGAFALTLVILFGIIKMKVRVK
jgi:hypothetical protein